MWSKKISSANNIWDREGLLMCGIGEKCELIARVKYIKKCIRWSYQRAVRGYSDCDKWNMYTFLQNLISEMLQDMRDNRYGSPRYLGENYTNTDGILVNDTCHDEWDKLLDHMIFLPEYKEISDMYNAEELELDTYRLGCKNEAMDLLQKHFYAL